MRTTAGKRPEQPPSYTPPNRDYKVYEAISAEDAIGKMAELCGYGREQAVAALSIARAWGENAEPALKGLINIRPEPYGLFTIEARVSR